MILERKLNEDGIVLLRRPRLEPLTSTRTPSKGFLRSDDACASRSDACISCVCVPKRSFCAYLSGESFIADGTICRSGRVECSETFRLESIPTGFVERSARHQRHLIAFETRSFEVKVAVGSLPASSSSFASHASMHKTA